MTTKPGLPPNIEDILRVFPITSNTVFTYGTDVYTQGQGELPEYILAHEAVHVQQQSNPKEWWDRYLIDAHFRLEQELEAFGEQYKWMVEHFPSRMHKPVLFDLANQLCGETYGHLMSFQEAENKIRWIAKSQK